jgi:hypothetical protein
VRCSVHSNIDHRKLLQLIYSSFTLARTSVLLCLIASIVHELWLTALCRYLPFSNVCVWYPQSFEPQLGSNVPRWWQSGR